MISLDFLASFDAQVLSSVQNAVLPQHWLETFFSIITLLGHPVVWLIIAAVLFWIRDEKKGFFLVNTIVFSVAAAGVLKAIVQRPRPDPGQFVVDPEPAWLSRIAADPLQKYSFPSGHATMISSMVGFYWRKIDSNWKILSVIGIVLVGLSRLVLGVHFLSDVLAGIVVGLLVGKLSQIVSDKLVQRQFRLSNLEDEFGVLVVVLAAVVAIAFSQPPALVLTLAGFYVGFFLNREHELHQTKLERNPQIVKAVLGLAGLGIGFLAATFALSGALQWALFAICGFWISYLYPWLYQTVLIGKTPKKGF
jgi:membrane-associated phospholipid phosphatase